VEISADEPDAEPETPRCWRTIEIARVSRIGSNARRSWCFSKIVARFGSSTSPLPTCARGDIIAVARHVGTCPCLVEAGTITVAFARAWLAKAKAILLGYEYIPAVSGVVTPRGSE
jgi:hypothetical protein